MTPFVDEQGALSDQDGAPAVVGIDFDAVTIGHAPGRHAWVLTPEQSAELRAMLEAAECRALAARELIARMDPRELELATMNPRGRA